MEKVLPSNGGSDLGVDTSEMRSTQGHSRDAHKPPTPQEWEGVKAAIYDLYVKRDLPLKEVRVEMECRGHIAR
jgi:Clr5 domain